MLKIITAAAAASAIALLSAPAACAETAYREVPLNAPHSMVVMGDSIATGYGLEGYQGGKDKVRSYVNILKDKYTAAMPADCSFELENYAVDGYTSDDLLNLLNSGDCDSRLSQADCVVISIGGNDLLHALWDTLSEKGIGRGGQLGADDLIKLLTSMGALKDKLDENLETFEKNLVSIAEYISGKTEGEFFIQTLYDPLESFKLVPGLSSVAAEKIGRLNELIMQHASEQGAEYTVCNVAPEFEGKANKLTNIGRIDIHPNADGHKVISDVLDRYITSKKYSYMQAYEAEPANTADDDGTTSIQGSPAVVIAVICAGCALAAGAAAIAITKRGEKRRNERKG